MRNRSLHVLSIHDHNGEGHLLSFDLKDLMEAIVVQNLPWKWCMLKLDAFGEGVDEFCDTVEASRGGIWMSSKEIFALALKIEQTIEAQILAFPANKAKATLSKEDFDIGFFPRNSIEMAIVAVDSSYFEVYIKGESLAKKIRAYFRDVRDHDPTSYFK